MANMLQGPQRCEIAECQNEGTEIRDYSIQLPDYRWFCKDHVGEADRKRTEQFNANMARLTREKEDRVLAEADAIRAGRGS